MRELRNGQGLTEAEFLAAYRPGDYERPSVTADVVLFTLGPARQLQVLLIRRGDHPCLGQWALPGGFVNMDEGLEAAARRELAEETAVADCWLEQLHTYGDVGRDPRTRIITCTFLALADRRRLKVCAGDDAEEARWFSLEAERVKETASGPAGSERTRQHRLTLRGGGQCLQAILETRWTWQGGSARTDRRILDGGGIAFDHSLMLLAGLQRLREGVFDTPMAFSLVGELFTLDELQQAFEQVLGTSLARGHFRRKMAGRVLATDRYRSEAGRRPERLYRADPRWQAPQEGLL